MTWITVSITRTAGSAPRNAGTQMQVFSDHITTAGGGGGVKAFASTSAQNANFFYVLFTGRAYKKI